MSARDDLLRVLDVLEQIDPWARGNDDFGRSMQAVHAGVYEDALALARLYVAEPVLLPRSAEDPTAFVRMMGALTVMEELRPYLDEEEICGTHRGPARDDFAEAFRRARREAHEASIASARTREIVRLRAEHAEAYGRPPRW